MTPVTGGNMNPPKKSNHQVSLIKVLYSVTMGSGNAQRTAHTPTTHYKIQAYLTAYPPNIWVTMPPTITPDMGPEKLIAEKYQVACSLVIPRTVCM